MKIMYALLELYRVSQRFLHRYMKTDMYVNTKLNVTLNNTQWNTISFSWRDKQIYQVLLYTDHTRQIKIIQNDGLSEGEKKIKIKKEMTFSLFTSKIPC